MLVHVDMSRTELCSFSSKKCYWC